MNANPFVYQLFLNNQQKNNLNNYQNMNNMELIKATSEKIKDASKKGGILPRLNNNNNNNNSLNNTTKYDQFPGNTNPRIVLMFISGTGLKVAMNVPINISVHDLFVAFIHRMNLDESVLGKYIYFLYNGNKLKIDEQKTVLEFGFKESETILVLDTSNLLGGEINL